MVYNPTSPIRSFQIKQKTAEIAKPAIEQGVTQSKEIAMSSFEQTPTATALEENSLDMKAALTVAAQHHTAMSQKSEVPAQKPTIASPTVSSGFSEDDTVQMDGSSNVNSLSRRHTQSWAGSMKRLIGRSTSVLQSENKLSKQQPAKTPLKISEPIAIPAPFRPKRSSNPIEVPPKARPTSKSTTKSSPVDPAYDPVRQRFRSSKDEKAEAAPIAITKPDEPRSFLDLDSSSDEELPVVQRASSVRVSKPQIVRHASSSGKQASLNGERKGSVGPSMGKAEKVLGEPLVNLYDLKPSGEILEEPAVEAHADALAKLEGKTEARGEEAGQHASVLGLPLTPKQHEKDVKSTTIVVADHPDNAEAHDVFVSPQGNLTSIRASVVSSMNDTVPELPHKTALDGLRSNPISNAEKSLLSRTISAPPLPNRNPNRRVTIRPTDLVIHHPDHDHRLFRESIVTTPYPPTASKKDKEKVEEFSSPTEKPTVSILPPHTGKTDRFPSPTATDEHLFLTLTLARNPARSTTIEITIPSADATTYDDHRLFSAIRSAYNTKLLGLSRLAFSCARTLSHATPGSSDMYLDSIDFINHLNRPKLGHKLKGWLIWLRNQQPLPKRASSLFSAATSPVDTAYPPHSAHHSMAGMSGFWSNASPHSGGSGSGSVSVPRMPFMKSAARDLPPLIQLHYRFNLLHISIAVFFVLMMSVLSTILWVLFGYPGLHAGSEALGASLGPTVMASGRWQGDAQLRVLTGLVLGMSVLVLGGTGVAGWVAGAGVLL